MTREGVKKCRPVLSLVYTLLVPLLLVFLFFGDILWTSAPLGSYPDKWVTLWSLEHVQSWLLGDGDTQLYYTSILHAPGGSSLLLHNLTESVGAVAALSGLEALRHYNLIIALVFLANFIVTQQLFFRLSLNRAFASFLTAIFCFHPYHLAHLDGGHLNLLSTFPLALLMLGAFNLWKEDQKFSIEIFLALVIATFTDWYILYLCLISLGGIMFFKLAEQVIEKSDTNSEFIKVLCLSTTPALLLSSCKIIPALQLARQYSGNHNPVNHSLNFLHYFYPGQYQKIGDFVPELPETWNLVNGAESAGYIGIALTAALLLAIMRSKLKIALILLIFALLTIPLGPAIKVSNLPSVPNPVFLMLDLLPIQLPVPARASCLTVLVVLMLIAKSFPIKMLTVLPLVLLAFVEFFPAPLKTTVINKDPLMDVIRNQNHNIIADLGTPELATFRTLLHHTPITSGFLARRPKSSIKNNRRLRRSIRKCTKSNLHAILSRQDQTTLNQQILSCGKFKRSEESAYFILWENSEAVTD